MNAEAKLKSRIIESVAGAVSNWTVDRHASANPRLANVYGTDWRKDWVLHTKSQIQFLVQAVAVRSPSLFAISMRWTFESFEARGIDANDVTGNLKGLHDILKKELPPNVANDIDEYFDAAMTDIANPISSNDEQSPGGQSRNETILLYLEALLAGDRGKAESTILSLADEGISMAEILEEVLSPAQARLGRLWHRGEITIGDEHFGSAITRDIMSQLRSRYRRAPENGRTVVCTSTPGDFHDIGLRMVADLFELDGWKVTFLGANMPTADAIEIMERQQADLVAISANTALSLRDAGEFIEAIRSTQPSSRIKVLIGGPPFRSMPDLWRELEADACALSATDAVTTGNSLVANT